MILVKNSYKQFDTPKQVLFVDDTEVEAYVDQSDWYIHSGVAYNDYVICNCCGSIIPLSDVAYIYVFNNWTDVSDTITQELASITVTEELKCQNS